MTTANANEIAGELTAGEIKLLTNPDTRSNYGAIESWQRLRHLGLIEIVFGEASQTDLGVEVLAVLATRAPAGKVGEAVITAAEFEALKRLARADWCMPKHKDEREAFQRFILLGWAHIDEQYHYYVTDKGREVLAQGLPAHDGSAEASGEGEAIDLSTAERAKMIKHIEGLHEAYEEDAAEIAALQASLTATRQQLAEARKLNKRLIDFAAMIRDIDTETAKPSIVDDMIYEAEYLLTHVISKEDVDAALKAHSGQGSTGEQS